MKFVDRFVGFLFFTVLAATVVGVVWANWDPNCEHTDFPNAPHAFRIGNIMTLAGCPLR